ncbi:hypothetical protein TNCV_3223081 [Trichonephila clavipes]|nr:hypothetical protein TNCV_3223081 [Trichonephila clavipes]
MSSRQVHLKTRRAEEAMHAKSVEDQTFCRWYCVEARRWVAAQVSSSSLDYGSLLRGPLPKVLEYLNSVT